jgi:hypothetical protein
MPSVKESSTIDRSRISPALAPTLAPQAGPSAVVADASLQMSPFFHASLPVTAATYDSLTRQYYRNSSLPQTRLLPAGGVQ